jgi:phosphoribosylaminoimidazole-succinocarboxamide synthase
MKNRKMIYDGKAKTIYEGPVCGTAIQYFKDDATAFNKEKHALIEGKGVLTNMISSFIMERLESCGINTHFIKRLNMREQLVKFVDIIPLEIVVRRKAYGSICKRYKIVEGSVLSEPLVELFLKDDSLGDPLIASEAAVILGFCEAEELEEIINLALRITDILAGLFSAIGLDLADIKYEFGVTHFIEDLDAFPELVLADEISPDNCRLRDLKTGEAFDKDLFRHDTGDLTAGYTEVARRLNLLPQLNKIETEEMATVTNLQDAIADSLKDKKLKKNSSIRFGSDKKKK